MRPIECVERGCEQPWLSLPGDVACDACVRQFEGVHDESGYRREQGEGAGGAPEEVETAVFVRIVGHEGVLHLVVEEYTHEELQRGLVEVGIVATPELRNTLL